MGLEPEELQAMSVMDVVREAVAIGHGARQTFALITLALVLPLSIAVLAHSLFTHPILLQVQENDAPASQWLLLLLLYQFAYLLFLFTFSLLCTAAVVFTVASIYAAKPVSFASSLAAVRPIFSRLFRTFLWVALLMLLYNLAYAIAIFPIAILLHGPLFLLLSAAVAFAFLAVHVYISALWHLASVVSVLEPLCGLAAMAKSRDLLRGRGRMAATLVAGYLGACAVIGASFRALVVKGAHEEGSLGVTSVPARVLIGYALVTLQVVVNFIGLLVQSVFYYVCKSHHHQQIDKRALYDHLGGYLGEYVPLRSSVQMENL
ncbi:uncharacterized protein LOC122044376 [Zingiber officinale]|uniref:Uncharacterized protein n=1 Tax=Zingiber officinale TaxID=94328 RepID=A0A8J5LNN1_ZINOF|nr:uncharacterized protein LOC122044376 [Zingiber officinale]KAG6527135.1 hypothetical protein ZIOFF_009228 [Zingiber officinale]